MVNSLTSFGSLFRSYLCSETVCDTHISYCNTMPYVFFHLFFPLLEEGDDLTYNMHLQRNQILGWFCLFMVLCQSLSISADLL